MNDVKTRIIIVTKLVQLDSLKREMKRKIWSAWHLDGMWNKIQINLTNILN